MTAPVTGLIGWPVAHSLSPVIHRHWLEHYKLPGSYELFPCEPVALKEMVEGLREKKVAGFNVTVPHKQAVMAYLGAVDETAERIGAVNTVTLKEGEFSGTNTDAYGFTESLKSQLGELTPYLDNILLLGAGGATRAIIVALQDAGAGTITVTNRTGERATVLADAFGIRTAPWETRAEKLDGMTLVVNTTSLGMKKHPPLLLDLDLLPKSAAVCDIVYAPLETGLLKAARVRGNKVAGGLSMLLYQAQLAFQTWHGILPQVTPALREAVLKAAL